MRFPSFAVLVAIAVAWTLRRAFHIPAALFAVAIPSIRLSMERIALPLHIPAKSPEHAVAGGSNNLKQGKKQ